MMPNATTSTGSSPGLNLTYIAKVNKQVRQLPFEAVGVLCGVRA